MANNIFNPEVNTGNPQQFLNYSRGVDVNTQGDTSTGKLFSGLGDMISVATKATTAAIDSTITNAVQSSVDSIRAEMGVEDATNTQEAPGRVTPALLENSYRELERNTKAMQAGTLKDSHYWARLNSLARQMRAQFPGHRDEIDQKIAGMVGTTPANALIRSLQSEAAAAASKSSSEENRFMTFFQSNIGKGNVDASLAAAVQNGIVDRPTFYRMMADKEHSEKLLDLSIKGLNLRKQRNEAISDDAAKEAGSQINTRMSDMFLNQTSVLGQNWGKLQSQITDINMGKLSLTPEVQEGIIRYYSLAEQAFEQEALKLRTAYNGLAPPDKVEEHLGVWRKTMQEMKKDIAEGKIGYVSRIQLQLETVKKNSQLDVIKIEALRRVAAIKDTLGPDLLMFSLPKDAPSLTLTQQALTSYLTDGMILGRSRSLADAVGEVKGLAGDPPGSTVLDRAVVGNAARLIAEPRTPDQGRAKLINNFFSDENKRYLAAVPQQERGFIFNQMTSPAVEAKVLEMGKSDPDLVNKYNSWVRHTTSVHSVPTLNNLAQFKGERGDFVDISFNGTEFIATPKALKSASDAPGQRTEEIRARQIVRDLNAYYRPLASMYEREGKGRDLAAYHLVNTVGLGSSMVPNALTTTKGGGGDDPQSKTPDGESGGDIVSSVDVTSKGIVFRGEELSAKELRQLKEAMAAQERGAGIPGAKPDFSSFSEDTRVPEDIMKDLSSMSPDEQAKFWQQFMDFRKKDLPKTPQDATIIEDFMTRP